jgi:hypothetical protein
VHIPCRLHPIYADPSYPTGGAGGAELSPDALAGTGTLPQLEHPAGSAHTVLPTTPRVLVARSTRALSRPQTASSLARYAMTPQRMGAGALRGEPAPGTTAVRVSTAPWEEPTGAGAAAAAAASLPPRRGALGGGKCRALPLGRRGAHAGAASASARDLLSRGRGAGTTTAAAAAAAAAYTAGGAGSGFLETLLRAAEPPPPACADPSPAAAAPRQPVLLTLPALTQVSRRGEDRAEFSLSNTHTHTCTHMHTHTHAHTLAGSRARR